jgi:Ca-activated chloride channel homolog
MNVTFAYPAALFLLLAIPAYLYALRRSGSAFPVPRAGALSAATAVARIAGAIPTALRVGTLAALALALAGPATAGVIVEERQEGIPIVIVLDISSSMLAQDFRPRDRLEVAKATIGRFIASRSGDPVGLVAFAGEAITLVPPTTHLGVLLSATESLRVGIVEDGTAIGDGLATAINRLRHIERGAGVIVLLSDGENNRGIDPLQAAGAAAALGVPVFTIGVGSEGVAPVPIGAAPAGFRYAELPVGLDEDLLRDIAERTGGQYFRATDPAALQRIYDEIDRLVPTVVETVRQVESRDWTAFLLILAGSLLVGEWGVRGSRWGALP